MTKIYKLSKGWENIYPATTSDAVVHPGTRTSINKLFNEINVSVVYPTSGIGRTNKYSLEGAIAQVPQELRNIGLKVSFINSDGKVETWEFQGGVFTDTEKWQNKLSMLSDDINAFNDAIVKVNNHNYIKGWDEANSVVKRIYVENKEKAIQDGLNVVEVFKNLKGVIGKNGVNFGTKDNLWKIQLHTLSGDDRIEATTEYGKIEVWVDWDKFNFDTESIYHLELTTDSNLNDIAFDRNEFDAPEKSTAYIANKSVTKEKLSDDLIREIESNHSIPALKGYELFTLCDSLGQGGIWQQKVAELTGCSFDQNKNIKPGASLSVGGTTSYGEGFDNMMWRAKNLIDSKYIKDEGDNAIIILKNVNDFSLTSKWEKMRFLSFLQIQSRDMIM